MNDNKSTLEIRAYIPIPEKVPGFTIPSRVTEAEGEETAEVLLSLDSIQFSTPTPAIKAVQIAHIIASASVVFRSFNFMLNILILIF